MGLQGDVRKLQREICIKSRCESGYLEQIMVLVKIAKRDSCILLKRRYSWQY
jgi:hypothetical protein